MSLPIDPNLFAIREFHPSFSRFESCVSCSGSTPSCPTCESGYTCTATTQSCSACATTKCIYSGGEQSSQPKSGGTNTGAIAGGVIGGIAAVALILFLIWWFAIRGKRKERAAQLEKNSQFAASRSERQSTQSIASTVLTRASNVIQIAYIPGVTNRSPPETPASLVPPVPPLPGAHPDQHFFMPGDLRDSSWTTTTGGGHQSMAPTFRSSVATTIYRNDAVVSPMPAQQISLSRANMVTVSGSNSPDDGLTPVAITPADAPAVPAITSAQLAKADAIQAASSPANNANANSSIVARTVMAKPVMVRGASLKKKGDVKVVGAKESASTLQTTAESTRASSQFDHQTSTFDGSSSDEDDDDTQSSNLNTPKKGVPAISVMEVPETPEPTENSGPFRDQTSSSESSPSNSNTTVRNSRHSDRIEPPRRVESPFSDVNEVKL